MTVPSRRRELIDAADAMRARVLDHREARRALLRPLVLHFDEQPARLDNDDPFRPLAARDPRALQLEYEYRRRRFWSEYASADEVREHGRECIRIARHLVERVT